MPDATGNIKGAAIADVPWHDREPLLPYQYELVFDCMQEPLTAYELSCLGRWRGHANAQSIAARLRPLVKRGWLECDGGIYRATRTARRAVSW